MDRRFIESHQFPVDRVSEASSKEKQGGGRPPYWEMVFWWTRKPLASARAVIAGALLPDSISREEFMYATRLSGVEGVPHRNNPFIPARYSDIFRQARLLDPFSGFGSIPLEAIRLGVGEVVAVELLPVAYVFLKAVLEIPKWASDRGLGEKLVEDVGEWGEWVLGQLRMDGDIQELYDGDTAVYIGSWEIKCPHCGRYTPLIGNWWLARTSRVSSEESESEEEEGVRKGLFQRLAWMEPVRQGDTVHIGVVDLNKELGRTHVVARVNSKQGLVEVEGRQYRVPRPNIDARRETAICLLCNNQVGKVGGEWYVKTALREWNQNLEKYLSGQMTLRQLQDSRAMPRLLVKVKIVNGELVFEPATQQDNEKLWKALEKLRQMWGDPDIPTEPIPPYGNIGAGLRFPVHIINKWYQLFNPRQLLTLVKLVKLVREAGRKVEEEKLREGWDREKAHKYAEAVTTYLAIALVKYANYSSLIAVWNPSLIMAYSLSMRGIAMVWNWDDMVPWISWTGTYARNLKTLEEGLSYLVSAVSGSPSRVRVLLDDATTLSRLGDEKFDLIVTDPPYRDDIAYAELSDFYYVWLKRALSDVKESFGVYRLSPRFYQEAFFDEAGNEVETQWKRFAPREVSEVASRGKAFGSGVGSFEYFKRLLGESFKAMASRLREDGAIVTFYAHTSPDAWEALLEAGWLSARMRITAAHSIVTESVQRVTARGKAALDTSIVAVWRRGVAGEALAGEVYAKAVELCKDFAFRARGSGYRGPDLFVATLGCVLSQFTQYERVLGTGNSSRQGVQGLVEKYVYPAVAEAIARSLGALAPETKLSPVALFYLLSKTLLERSRAARRSMDRSTLNLFVIGTRSSLEELEKLGVIDRDGDKVILLEPGAGDDPKTLLKQLLADRGVKLGQPTIRSSIDALHILEYLAVTQPREDFLKGFKDLESKFPQHIEEAVSLAKALASALPENEAEKKAVEAMLKALGIQFKKGLESFFKEVGK